jgi:hypothetical protein
MTLFETSITVEKRRREAAKAMKLAVRSARQGKAVLLFPVFYTLELVFGLRFGLSG